MAIEPVDVIMPMLREIRAEVRQGFEEVGKCFEAVEQRLDKLESGQKTIRQAMQADTMMSRLVTGEFEDRIFELERKVDALMKGK